MSAKKMLGLALLFLMVSIAMGSVMWARTGQDQPPSSKKETKSMATPIGGQVPNSNSLRDVHGNRRSLHSFKNNKAIVLVFLGTECPVSNLYAPA